MRSIPSSLLTFAVGLSTVFVSGAASARTIPAASGMPASLSAIVGGQSVDDFAWLNTGLIAPNATAASPRTWVIGLPIDTSGFKFFIVKGTPSSGLGCLLEQRGTVQQSVSIAVSAVGTNPIPLGLNVTAGDTIVVRCTFTNSNGRVLLVDYTP